MTEHWFWLALTAACVLWYSTITIFVAFKGVKDIRGMLHRLAEKAGMRGDADEQG